MVYFVAADRLDLVGRSHSDPQEEVIKARIHTGHQLPALPIPVFRDGFVPYPPAQVIPSHRPDVAGSTSGHSDEIIDSLRTWTWDEAPAIPVPVIGQRLRTNSVSHGPGIAGGDGGNCKELRTEVRMGVDPPATAIPVFDHSVEISHIVIADSPHIGTGKGGDAIQLSTGTAHFVDSGTGNNAPTGSIPMFS